MHYTTSPQESGLHNMQTLIWSSTSHEFALVSPELAQAMLAVGSLEGFNRATSSPPVLTSIELSQEGKQTKITLRMGEHSYWHKAGRVESKRLVKILAAWTKAPAFNVKDNGKRVLWIA